ncbi:acyl-CoA N-acyltransferase [Tricladium varicosporioides]|nr:acyl-CoA N-acyltransferase [Hymenoscyphus varicosporioides]
MSLTTAGNAANGTTTSTTSKPSPKPNSEIIIRQAHFSEYTQLGVLAAKAFFDSPLTAYLSPHRKEHYSHYQRGFKQRVLSRLLDPRNLSFVAVQAEKPDVVIGYAQFVRYGEDEGAQKQMRSRKSIWLTLLGWLWVVWLKVLEWVDPDRSSDDKALASFIAISGTADKRQWSLPCRANRWHAQSVVVKPSFQGQGIGKRLIREGIKRAEEENVCVGLEASGLGEKMYLRVGFRLLERFEPLGGVEKGSLPEHEGKEGGVMIWEPSSWKYGIKSRE